MKKQMCLLLALAQLLCLCACGGSQPEQAPAAEAAEWSRAGYFTDENGNVLSVTLMEDVVDPGWYVGFMNGEDLIEDSYGGIVQQEGNSLKGSLSSGGKKADVTVSIFEEGEEDLLLVVEGGESYHFAPMNLPDATIFVHIDTEGLGNIDYAEGEAAPELDPEYPYQSAQINLAEPATYTLLAWTTEGNHFLKWTRNGEDFSTEAQITLLLDESADFVAVFEAD